MNRTLATLVAVVIFLTLNTYPAFADFALRYSRFTLTKITYLVHGLSLFTLYFRVLEAFHYNSQLVTDLVKVPSSFTKTLFIGMPALSFFLSFQT